MARDAKSASLDVSAAVLNQRASRGVEVVLLLGRRRVEEKRRRLDRVARRRLLERPLGGVGLAGLEQRAPVQRQRLARGARARCHALERLAGLAEECRVVARALQPDLAERAVDLGFGRMALERAAEREHRQIPVAAARVRHADGDLPLDAIAVEAGEHLQLLELLGAAVRRAVQVGQLFARRNEARARARRHARSRAAPRRSVRSRAGTARAGSARRPSGRRAGRPRSARPAPRRRRGCDSGRAPACS